MKRHWLFSDVEASKNKRLEEHKHFNLSSNHWAFRDLPPKTPPLGETDKTDITIEIMGGIFGAILWQIFFSRYFITTIRSELAALRRT